MMESIGSMFSSAFDPCPEGYKKLEDDVSPLESDLVKESTSEGSKVTTWGICLNDDPIDELFEACAADVGEKKVENCKKLFIDFFSEIMTIWNKHIGFVAIKCSESNESLPVFLMGHVKMW